MRGSRSYTHQTTKNKRKKNSLHQFSTIRPTQITYPASMQSKNVIWKAAIARKMGREVLGLIRFRVRFNREPRSTYHPRKHKPEIFTNPNQWPASAWALKFCQKTNRPPKSSWSSLSLLSTFWPNPTIRGLKLPQKVKTNRLLAIEIGLSQNLSRNCSAIGARKASKRSVLSKRLINS